MGKGRLISERVGENKSQQERVGTRNGVGESETSNEGKS